MEKAVSSISERQYVLPCWLWKLELSAVCSDFQVVALRCFLADYDLPTGETLICH